MLRVLQAGRAGMPPWRMSRSFGGSSDDGGSSSSGDDNLTARAGAQLLPPCVHQQLAL